MRDTPTVSFCTTCMGRVEHLKQTLPKNIADNAGYPDCQFVVVNYGAEPETDHWIRENFQQEMASEKLKYVSYPGPEHFHMAHAKNMAHRMADGEILCNIDADQYTGPGFAKLLAEHFSKAKKAHKSIYMGHAREIVDAPYSQRGSQGKIALLRADFEKMRGYNEAFQGWGNEDINFTARLRNSGISFSKIPSHYADSIEHPHDLRLENIAPEHRAQSYAEIIRSHHPSPIKRMAQRVLGAVNTGDRSLRDIIADTRIQQRTSAQAVNQEGFGSGTVYVNLNPTPLEIENISSGLHSRSAFVR